MFLNQAVNLFISAVKFKFLFNIELLIDSLMEQALQEDLHLEPTPAFPSAWSGSAVL